MSKIPERRISLMNKDELERLVRIDENLIHVKEWALKHDEKDDLRFDKVQKQVGWIQKVIFMGLGALALLKLFLK